MIDQFKDFIEQADSILVTAHISPDPDAFSSAALAASTLKLNYPTKKIAAALEEMPEGLGFIPGAEAIEHDALLPKLKSFKPDLLILLDGNNYDRFSRHDGPDIRELVKDRGTRTVIIDHHEPAGKDGADLYIHRNSYATAQDVYQICFNELGLQKPAEAAQTAMVGFFADTGGFVYAKQGLQTQMFDFAKELVEAGADVEQVQNKLSQFSQADLKVIEELIANSTTGDGYSYSYLSDEFMDEWLASGKTESQLKLGVGTFLDDYIRNIEGRPWGFIAYHSRLQGENMYSVSLRAVGGTKDVSKIAAKLNGGGHKPAAGGKLEAQNIQQALDIVKQAISG